MKHLKEVQSQINSSVSGESLVAGCLNNNKPWLSYKVGTLII
jgi:hypothetical protein